MAIAHQFPVLDNRGVHLSGCHVESYVGSQEVKFGGLYNEWSRQVFLPEGEEVDDITALIKPTPAEDKTIVVVIAKNEKGSVSHYYTPQGEATEYEN